MPEKTATAQGVVPMRCGRVGESPFCAERADILRETSRGEASA